MNVLKNFTIIIPCINFKDVEKSILNIRQIYAKVKIIVCLNEKIKKNKDKNLKFICTKLKGIGAKRNLAVKFARTKYLAFIDSDAYPKKKWLENSLKFLKNKNIGVIAGPHIDPKIQNFSESLVGKVKKSFIITMTPHMQKDTKQKAKIVSFMPSCNWIMKKYNFLKCGGMDNKMLRNEDWDFVYNRMNKKNYKVLYNPKSIIFHENANISHFIKKRFLYGFFMWPILKKLNLKNFYFYLPFLFSLFLISFPLIFYSKIYLFFYFSVLLIYSSIAIIETLRISKNIIYFPIILPILILANISPGFGILCGLLNFNKEYN